MRNVRVNAYGALLLITLFGAGATFLIVRTALDANTILGLAAVNSITP